MKIRNGIDGFTLKVIAVVSMMIDHSAASLLLFMIKSGRLSGDIWIPVYEGMRGIGRTAFPVFCFLLVEGFVHTGNKAKYLGRLFLFALLSEIPFDLALWGAPFDFAHQNVFFTLFLGMAVLCILEQLEKSIRNRAVYGIASFLAILSAMGVSELLHTDYHKFGVLVVVVFYLLRDLRMAACVTALFVLILCFSGELMSVLSFPLLLLYNGKRGKGVKYFFYVFYPAHLMVLYMAGCCLGLYRFRF